MAETTGKPLHAKLGLKPGMLCGLIDAPAGYTAMLGESPPPVALQNGQPDAADLTHVFVTRRARLVTLLPDLLTGMNPDGMIWVSWPKRASRVETDVTEDVVREVALPLGLVDVKVCAVDAVWSGLKLVIRKALRPDRIRVRRT
jgi:hypothetical protein